MMASGGKPEKNPSVSVWLKYHDPELYEAIDDQGILAQLRPRFGSELTFLYPAEKSYRDNIIKHLNGQDATVGVNMVQALIIVRENLEDAADWLERKDNIPNALSQKVELSDESTNKQVILANGATLTLNKDFASRDKNISVWDYKGKEEMPLNGKPSEFVKRPPKASKPKRKTGGNAFSTSASKLMLAKRLEDQSAYLLASDGGREAFNLGNPYTAAMVSLMQYMEEVKGTSLDQFKLMCEPNSVAAFYAIVLPYTADSVLQSDIDNWLQTTRGICLEDNPNQVWASYIQKLGDLGSEIHNELYEDNTKDKMTGMGIVTIGESLYKNKFPNKHMLRLKGDEIRFVIHTVMAKDNLTEADFSQMCLDIKILYSVATRNSFFLVPARTDPVFAQTISVFIASRCFMSVPNVPAKREGITPITFHAAFNTETNIDVDTHFIENDEKYLSQTTSAPETNFVSNLAGVFSKLSTDAKAKLLAALK